MLCVCVLVEMCFVLLMVVNGITMSHCVEHGITFCPSCISTFGVNAAATTTLFYAFICYTYSCCECYIKITFYLPAHQ